jgi:eukaryotic-like serine/threonine-protein kinase
MRTNAFLLLALVFASSLSGCGGSSEPVTTTATVTSETLPSENAVSVPLVEGMIERNAVAVLRAERLVPQVHRSASDAVDEGLVLQQDPPAGTRLESGSEVTITISTG